MVRYLVIIECSDVVMDLFEIGRTLGNLIEAKKWLVLDTSHDNCTMMKTTRLGFPTRHDAEVACDCIDDLGVAGLNTFIEEVPKGL